MPDQLYKAGSIVGKLPLLSVIITNHNYANYILQAIDSIKSQTYENLECVVIDDASSDDSFQLVSDHFQKLKDDRFRVIRLARNVGQMAAMKAGLENTTGVFVHFLDADDIVFPDFAEWHIRAHLNSSYSAGVTASDTAQIDADGQVLESTFHMLLKHRTTSPESPVKPIGSAALPRFENNLVQLEAPLSSLFYIERFFEGWHVVQSSAFVFRRDVLNVIIPKDNESMRICADYYWMTFVHWISGTLTIGATLSGFRLHRKNKFSNQAVLGGRYAPGFFRPEIRRAIDEEIAKFIIENIDQLVPMLGLEYPLTYIRKIYNAGSLYRAVKHSKTIRNHLSRGSDRLFRIKYGTRAHVYNHYPKLFKIAHKLRKLIRKAA